MGVRRKDKPLSNEWLVAVLSLAAAFAFAVSSSLKHVSAGHAPDAQSLHPGKVAGFIRATLSHPLWLGGIGCDVVGLVLQIIALHLGALAVVQPLLISGLLFALILRQRYEHAHITAAQIAWAVLLTVTLAGFLLLVASGNPGGIHETADRLPAAVAGVAGAVLAAACIELGRRQRAEGRSAALLGVAVGIIYAATAAMLKALTDIAVRSPLHLLISWQLYSVIALGAAGLLLNQLAFQAGPITASLPATATIDPLLSIVVGVLVYDERISRGPGNGGVLIGLLLLLGIAVIQLARTPPPNEDLGGSEARTVVFFHAHPDDEALLTGGTMARLAASGHRVVLVTATAGEAGLVSAELAASEPTGERRRRELSRSAEALGCARVVVLGYADSGMAAAPSGAERAFTAVPVEESAAVLARLLAEEAADVLCCYDPAGGYGHPDHVRVNQVGLRAAELAGTRVVLEATVDRRALQRALRLISWVRPGLAELRPSTYDHCYTHPDGITHRVDVIGYLPSKRAAMQAHASQATSDGGTRTLEWFLRLPAPLFRLAFGREWFVEHGRPAQGAPIDDVLDSLH